MLIIFLLFELNEYILIADDFVFEIVEINIHENFNTFIVSFVFRQILEKNFTIVNNFTYVKILLKMITSLNIIILLIDKLISDADER